MRERLMGEFRTLQARTEALEKGRSAVVVSTTGPAAAKRARSEPRRGPQKRELKPLVVLTGLPFNSRKKDVDAVVKPQLAEHEEWEHLTPFALAVRTSGVMIKVQGGGGRCHPVLKGNGHHFQGPQNSGKGRQNP